MKLTIIIIVAGIFGLMACKSFFGNKINLTAITSEKGVELYDNGEYVFLDVRTAKEHHVKAIPNTPLVPVQELESRIGELEQYRNKKIVVYCRSGNRSGKATTILNKHGFDAVNLSGGMIRWNGPVTSNE
ncbi:MAG: rhodanese-like domain-containing protein [Candidatus Marinimicrobia bacterium]|jgi:rhodanese-related sulfurtransferase|nr:rhodanese-like domain-containing protein [Candidatus Neomarinimicrobiota bacterium]MBT3617533.1 rhodanese-like domain-containing protein [Candidatus Neomarinimicrobiota bacterium]MBT3829210.1 rhodanese-like domain-containing protein [Candidatus Neomarinimicrobiota bacterium]MBT3996796.1 rhodanese-like domain-containing protein [Candidatus Neomarinimicrobiota bacterium]MBT4280334.1 rhodanese-like domain-containing protein [Candidatus Neomarinimicrobiota bacterium]